MSSALARCCLPAAQEGAELKPAAAAQRHLRSRRPARPLRRSGVRGGGEGPGVKRVGFPEERHQGPAQPGAVCPQPSPRVFVLTPVGTGSEPCELQPWELFPSQALSSLCVRRAQLVGVGSTECVSLEMGRHSSDTEDENRSRRKKKHRRRSSSSSSSGSRTYSRKKSGRKSRSRSRDLQSRSHSYEKRRRHRSSSSSSYGSRRKRSRSRSRGRGKSYRSQRSRSKSRTRRSRSRARQRSYSGSSERSSHRRTPSGSRERERRKGRDREKGKEKGKGKEKETCGTKPGDCGNIKAGLEHLTPAEQAKARLQLVLEAAAKADEALKAKERSEEEAKKRKEEDQATLVEQVKRVKEIEAIESDSFVPQTFRSSKEVKKSTEPPDLPYEPVTVGAGAADAPAPEKEPAPASIPTAIKYQDDNSLAHPNLFIEKAEAEEKWFQRLIALRQERLMGSPVA
ncbi:serine/Arginine-related protein 53 [Columba livia]|uniref:serine/Arginine-related protein 53 n=1 Tax=Columba livia TaxID=8932 RepID=UPI0031B9C0C0